MRVTLRAQKQTQTPGWLPLSAPGPGSSSLASYHDTHVHERHLVANNLDLHCVATDAMYSKGECSLCATFRYLQLHMVFFNSKGNVTPDILKYASRFVFSP